MKSVFLNSKSMIINDFDLFLALKSITEKQSKKMIIYTNKVENSKIIQEIINKFINNHQSLFSLDIDISDIGNYELNGKDKISYRNQILNKFSVNEYAIMSYVQLFEKDLTIQR